LLLVALFSGGLLLCTGLFRPRLPTDWRRGHCRALIATGAAWILGFIPWLPVLITDYRHAGAPGGFPLQFHWLQTPVFVYLKTILFGNQQYILDHAWLYPLPLLASLGIVGAVIRRIRQWEVSLLVMAATGPFLIVYSLSLLGMRVYKSHPFIIFHPAAVALLAFGLMTLSVRMRWITGSVLGCAQIGVLSTLIFSGDYIKPPVHHVADWIEQATGENGRARVAVVPAFIPNPMPIVGDLLAFRYHSADRFDTLYLTGKTANDVVRAIQRHREGVSADESPASGSLDSADELYVVCQINCAVEPYLEQIFQMLDSRWTRIEQKDFPSRIRGFGMRVVRYETGKL
ncbi:hypothetical protein JXA80_07585, partial [bacterium]|nr:hypothetical protein [candidate division CSSED10-310 bacterium]